VKPEGIVVLAGVAGAAGLATGSWEVVDIPSESRGHPGASQDSGSERRREVPWAQRGAGLPARCRVTPHDIRMMSRDVADIGKG
jgi:hypothetical protein